VISIASLMIIDAGTASSSAFQRIAKIVHDHAGIGVHVCLESAFTMRWKPRSPWTGICNRVNLESMHDTPSCFSLSAFARTVSRE
jgi:hypothetical protein